MTNPAVVTCPAGHTFPRDQVPIADGHLVCPGCHPAPPGAAWSTPARSWSRRTLIVPLLLVGFGFLAAALGGLGAYNSYIHDSLVVSGAGKASRAWAILSDLILAAAAMWAAIAVSIRR